MESVAKKKYIRISRRKIARIGKECIGKRVRQVKAQLTFLPNKSARELLQTLKSAESNFLVKSPNSNPDELLVKNILVDKGPSFKRMIYRAKGRGNRIEKKTSHVKIILEYKEKVATPNSVPGGKVNKEPLKKSVSSSSVKDDKSKLSDKKIDSK